MGRGGGRGGESAALTSAEAECPLDLPVDGVGEMRATPAADSGSGALRHLSAVASPASLAPLWRPRLPAALTPYAREMCRGALREPRLRVPVSDVPALTCLRVPFPPPSLSDPTPLV